MRARPPAGRLIFRVKANKQSLASDSAASGIHDLGPQFDNVCSVLLFMIVPDAGVQTTATRAGPHSAKIPYSINVIFILTLCENRAARRRHRANLVEPPEIT